MNHLDKNKTQCTVQNNAVLAVADNLFGLCSRSERKDKLSIGTHLTHTPHPHPIPNKPYVASVDVKHHNYLPPVHNSNMNYIHDETPQAENEII